MGKKNEDGKKHRPRLGDELMQFFEEQKETSNQPLDEVLRDPEVLDELKEKFVKNEEEDGLSLF